VGSKAAAARKALELHHRLQLNSEVWREPGGEPVLVWKGTHKKITEAELKANDIAASANRLVAPHHPEVAAAAEQARQAAGWRRVPRGSWGGELGGAHEAIYYGTMRRQKRAAAKAHGKPVPEGAELRIERSKLHPDLRRFLERAGESQLQSGKTRLDVKPALVAALQQHPKWCKASGWGGKVPPYFSHDGSLNKMCVDATNCVRKARRAATTKAAATGSNKKGRRGGATSSSSGAGGSKQGHPAKRARH